MGHEDIKVQIIGHCDPNVQEAREDFWILHLDTLHSQGLNQNRVLKYWTNWFNISMNIFGLAPLGHT